MTNQYGCDQAVINITVAAGMKWMDELLNVLVNGWMDMLMNKLHLLLISLLDRKVTLHVPQKTIVATKGSYVNLTCEFYNNDDISFILWLKLNPFAPYNTAIDQV